MTALPRGLVEHHRARRDEWNLVVETGRGAHREIVRRFHNQCVEAAVHRGVMRYGRRIGQNSASRNSTRVTKKEVS
ncbi:hypothetical protein [Paraburkholderia heleia]|uniref:hypothetical protein n=1 Tax=Paraburkholderia heleia TaxID=634127 RepID=UPI0012EE7EAA|nr:hypothetical protein [Paraburkholderia heleia]